VPLFAASPVLSETPRRSRVARCATRLGALSRSVIVTFAR
jgi:hypothetical protein